MYSDDLNKANTTLELQGRELIRKLHNEEVSDEKIINLLNKAFNAYLCRYIRYTIEHFTSVNESDIPLLISDILFKVWISRTKPPPRFISTQDHTNPNTLRFSFLAWLNKIAYRTVIDLYRQRDPDKGRQVETPTQLVSLDDEYYQATDFNEKYEQFITDCFTFVMGLVKRNYPKDHELLLLLAKDESNSNIAERFEISKDTLYQRKNTAKERLKNLFEKHC